MAEPRQAVRWRNPTSTAALGLPGNLMRRARLEFFRNNPRPHCAEALLVSPVPVLEAAIRQLRDRSISLDIYVWLAWRLHRLAKSTNISRPALHGQFGTGFKAIRQFKPQFAEALEAALAAYPEARVEVSDQAMEARCRRAQIR
jgi:hypothetical protein